MAPCMANETELHLPQLPAGPAGPSPRSVDEINEWIEQDYRDLFDREAYEREKRRLSVNVRFSLKRNPE